MIYLDTNVLIYLLEGDKQYAKRVAKYIESAKANNTKLVTSAITVAELMAGNSDITLDMLNMLGNLEIVPLDKAISERAGKLQNTENILIGDSVHLATALSYKCTTIYTNDDKLAKKSAKYIKIQKP